jgi:GLPGLI family protein
MIKLNILITIALIFSITLHSQISSGKVTYKASLDPELYLENVKKNTELTQKRKESKVRRAHNAVPTIFYLTFNENESLYKSQYDMKTNRKLGLLLNQTGNVARHERIYYSNKEKNESFFQSFWTQEVLVNQENINWTMTNETRKIGNYNCFKAEATITKKQSLGMNYLSPLIAWFTPEIPVSYGIQNFSGLPGLILELTANYENGKLFYKATKIELNTEVNIRRPKGKKQISEEKYIELREAMSLKRTKY